MHVQLLSDTLRENAARIQALVAGIGPEQARWKPSPDAWSILEVINHLCDEEREDFRVRLDLILHRPDAPWPPIDPEGWVHERGYNERDLATSLADFLAERERSLAWLAGLGEIDWDRSAQAPWGGPMRAGDMAAAWMVHDLLHMRQLVEILYGRTVAQTAPYDSRYAGRW